MKIMPTLEEEIREAAALGIAVVDLRKRHRCTELVDEGCEQCSPAKASLAKKPKRMKPTVAAAWSITLTLPCQVKSEANQRDHWSVRRRRFNAQADTVCLHWYASPLFAMREWLDTI